MWDEPVAPRRWPAYVGMHVFEDVAAQAYRRWAVERGLPPVPAWQRWTGRDRTRRQIDIDLVGRATSGELITGSVKFRTRPATAATYAEHFESLRRLADSGHEWAKEALEPRSPVYFASAGGFNDSFREVTDPARHHICWTLNDLYPTA